LTIAADSSNPAAGIIVQNLTGNTLAVFRFTETSNVEPVKVTQLNVLDKVASSGVLAAFSNVSLWNGSQELGTAASPVLDGTNGGYDYDFNSFNAPGLVVPQGNSVSLTLKGDAGSYTNGSLSDNTTSTFEVVAGTATGYVPPTATSTAVSTLTVNMSAAIASSTYSYTVTLNGQTSPTQTLFVGTDGSSTTTQENAIATAIASLIDTYYSSYGLSTSTQATSTNATATSSAYVTITSTGIANMGASASFQAFGVAIPANNITGTAGNPGNPGSGTSNVVARGATSNKNAVVTLSSASGNPMTTLRTLVNVTATPVTTLPPASFSQLGSLTFAANSAGDAELNNLTLTWNTSSTAFLGTVVLHDQSGNDIYLTDHFATSTQTSTAIDDNITLTFATSTKPLTITAGSSYTLTIWGDLSQIPTVSSQGLSLTATVKAYTDFGYLDGSSGSPALIYLNTNQANTLTPVNLQSGAGLPL